MFKNNLSRFMILMGFTLALPLGIGASPVSAQTSIQTRCPPLSPNLNAITYCFPAKDSNGNLTYIGYAEGGEFYYEGKFFQPNQINIVNSSIGKQVTVTIANGVDTLATFTLLLPNDNPQILNGPITAVGITINKVFVGVPPRETTTYVLLKGKVTDTP